MWDLAYNSASAPYAASPSLLPFPGLQKAEKKKSFKWGSK